MDYLAGYSFEADTYCVECTLKRFPLLGIIVTPDNEGNIVNAISRFDEFDYVPTCAVCHEELDVQLTVECYNQHFEEQ